jgi:hypothetical protein
MLKLGSWLPGWQMLGPYAGKEALGDVDVDLFAARLCTGVGSGENQNRLTPHFPSHSV